MTSTSGMVGDPHRDSQLLILISAIKTQANYPEVVEKNVAKKKAASTASHARRQDGVVFEFYNMDTAVEFTGSVSHDGKTMTIEIPAQAGYKHCLVKGSLRGHLFHGLNCYQEVKPVDVEATWCDVGDGYLCLWIEEGTEYVVRFTLSR